MKNNLSVICIQANTSIIKKVGAGLFLIAVHAVVLAQSVGIGTTTPNASAQLDITSTTRGLLTPRMTQVQRNAIVSPVSGLLVYQTDAVAGFYYYKDVPSGWQLITTGTMPNSIWSTLGVTNNIYNSQLGNVAIGTLPSSIYRLTVDGDVFVGGGPATIHLHGESGSNARIFFDVPENPQSYAITHSLNSLFLSRKDVGGFQFLPDLVINESGNVGVSVLHPDVKLHVSDGTDVGNASGGFLQLGSSTGLNIGFDNNEIQARNNGVVSRLVLQNGGGALQIGSAVTPQGYAVSINGKVICEELKIQGSSNWPDYVFANDYSLQSFDDLRRFIKANKHLPNIPTAAAIEKNGIEVGDMQKRLMEKIEELTLYVLQLEEQNRTIQKQIETLKKKHY
jgi:hypothetical protein